MKNTLTDLNNYLFEQIERLNDDSLTDEQVQRELNKTDRIVKIAEKAIEIGELELKAVQHMDEYGYGRKHQKMPKMLEVSDE